MVPVGGIVDGERFSCAAEDRATDWGCVPAYDDIGERLMTLRKEAWDRYSLRALWNIRPDATLAQCAASPARCAAMATCTPLSLPRPFSGKWTGGRRAAVPLDEFQKGITTLLSANRDMDSPFAGGPVIQQHGFWLSKDQDIFSGSDVGDIARQDIATLDEAGYDVCVRRHYDGFLECSVVKPEEGAAILQWTQALSLEFYQPVPDDRFGYRLHFADLAANKALAGATRSAVRDFVDLWMLGRHVLPLWRILCTAPGKDRDFNPLSMVERMLFNWHIAKARDMEEYVATTARSPKAWDFRFSTPFAIAP